MNRQRQFACLLVCMFARLLVCYSQPANKLTSQQANQPASQQSSLQEESKVLTLEDCLQIARQNHGSLAVAKENLQAAEAEVTAAESAFYPQLISQNTFFRGQTVGSQTGFSFRRLGIVTETRQYSLIAEQLIFDSGLTLAQVRQAKANRDAAKADVARTWNELAFTVTVNYFELLRAQKLFELAEQQLKSAEGHLELVNARVETGEAAPVDRHPVQVEVANARLNLVTAQNQVRVAASALANAMGLDIGQTFAVADVPEPSFEQVELEAALEEAMKHRPDLHRAQNDLRAAKAGLDLAKIQSRPLLTFNGAFEQGLFFGDRTSPTKRRWQFSALLSFPIFDGGASKAQVAQARSRYDALKADLKQLKKDVAAEVEQAYLELVNAQQRIEASKALVEQARQNLELQNEKYRVGEGLVIEIVDAQVDFFDAQVRAVQAVYDYYIAKARLERAMGVTAYSANKKSR